MSDLFWVVAIVFSFLVLAVLVSPYVGKSSERSASDSEDGVSLSRGYIVGRSLGDPLDQRFFDDQ